MRWRLRQYTQVAARYALRVESSLSDVELASFPCSYSTAENMLTRARLAKGERVLITGASGGVGSAPRPSNSPRPVVPM